MMKKTIDQEEEISKHIHLKTFPLQINIRGEKMIIGIENLKKKQDQEKEESE